MKQSENDSNNSRSNYAYIVTADSKYLPEALANLNSLHLIGNNQDVHFFGYKIPEDVIEQFSELCYKLVFHPVSDEEVEESRGCSEVMCRKRYWFAGEVGQDYDAVCVLDADMIWSHLPDVFFEIAAKTGLVVGACKEQNKVYNEPNHEYYGWSWKVPRGFYNPHDLCNCPLFIDARLWDEALHKQWQIFLDGFPEWHFKAPDMDAMNLALMEQSADLSGGDFIGRILPLPGLMFLGTNEQHFKPYINATMREDGLWTKNGIKIYSVHGHFLHKQWCGIQLSNRKGCIAGQLNGSESAYNQAEGSLEVLCRFAKHCLDDGPIKIEQANWRHPENPVDETYNW